MDRPASKGGQGRTPGIFISYRREDTPGHTGRLYDVLSRRFGPEQVFMDLGMDPGVDFVEQIDEAVSSCRLFIAVIGPGWATVQDAHGHRRLDDPADFIRVEVEAALRQDDVRVVPVLVQGATMPSAEQLPPSLAGLTRRNALELSDARWRYDVDRLTSTVERVLGQRAQPSATHRRLDRPDAEEDVEAARGRIGHPREPQVPLRWARRHLPLVIALAALVVAVGVGALLVASRSPSAERKIHSDSEGHVSPDGIEVSRLLASGEHGDAAVGDRITVDFSLKNVGSSSVTFEETFVGARDPGGANHDFGSENQGRVLAPGASIEVSRNIVVDDRGVWRFWPCYSLRAGGGAGECPDEWRSFEVSVGP